MTSVLYYCHLQHCAITQVDTANELMFLQAASTAQSENLNCMCIFNVDSDESSTSSTAESDTWRRPYSRCVIVLAPIHTWAVVSALYYCGTMPLHIPLDTSLEHCRLCNTVHSSALLQLSMHTVELEHHRLVFTC
eukprot:13803-Heterococcus_DN1.PRE.3